ncbi:PAS domain-containing protein [Stakelama pacifica]|uniref:histidine kinase n=1 Tax=Stakelama pacifica TaxID=517720 RepID=A0A4R6FV54_9SPHN|nr:PAS domain-containing protein [Stakelama pacifica]TDN85721.1 PAS/PAC sensor hybrid histidine kinase [Stakelama pacifica]GGO91822.1 ATPase [Stakelama pacifica]
MHSGLRFLDHPGEMAERIRNADWSAHPLGPIESWSQPLRFAVNICLGSRFPCAIYWGADQILLYNDAWAPIPADRHPWALGRKGAEVWADIWDVVGPQLAEVVDTAQGFATYDQQLMMERGGIPRETYWNYSFTPIRDETGKVVGILNQGNETTRSVMAARMRIAQIDRFREIVDQAPGAIALLHGPDYVFEIANRSYCDLIGRQDVIGRPVHDVVPEAVRQGFVALLDTVFRSGEPYRGDSVPIEFDRGPDQPPERRVIDFIYQPLTDKNGMVTDIFIEANDVTEKIEAVEALREVNEAQRFVHALSENLRDLDTVAAVMDFAAHALAERLGADRAGFVRVGPGDELDFSAGWNNGRLPPLTGRVAPETVSRFGLERFRNGETLLVQDLERESRPGDGRAGLSPAGIGVPVMRGGAWIASLFVSQATPRQWRQEDVALVEAVAETSWDAVERVEALSALRESEAQFRAITNSIDDMVWSSRPDGHVDFYNDRWYQFTGVPSGSTDGSSWANVLHPEDVERAGRTWQHSLATGEPYHIEYRMRHHSGTYRWALGRAQPVRDESGAITRWFGTCTEIQALVEAREVLARSREELEAEVDQRTRQLMEAEAKLRHAQKMEAVGQLTGGIAHDFNNMLAVVLGALDLMERRIERGEADVSRYIVAARDGASRAASLTQRLLAFSRRSPLSPQSVDVGEMVAGMSELLNRTLGEAIRVKTDISAASWSAIADPSQLENSIINLAVNARDAMPDGGVLRIATVNRTVDAAECEGSALSPGDYIEICVSDTGIGMAPDVAARAFDPFFTTKEVGKGTGLGLSQIFGFARQSGGDVRIESTPGTGTEVRLLLPRDQRNLPREDSARTGNRSAAAGGSETILLVEDETRVRAFSAEALRDLGYSVLEARNGEEALSIIASGAVPDLLFTDVIMPGMTGRALAERVRQQLPGLRLLFTSGYTRDAMDQASSLAPSTLVLPKPFGIGELARAVRDAIDGPVMHKGMDVDAPGD